MSDIKSNNPHLTGGEKTPQKPTTKSDRIVFFCSFPKISPTWFGSAGVLKVVSKARKSPWRAASCRAPSISG